MGNKHIYTDVCWNKANFEYGSNNSVNYLVISNIWVIKYVAAYNNRKIKETMKQTNKQRTEMKKSKKVDVLGVYGNVASLNDEATDWLSKTTFKFVVVSVVLMTFIMFII